MADIQRSEVAPRIFISVLMNKYHLLTPTHKRWRECNMFKWTRNWGEI